MPGKRELIEPKGDKRYVRRDEHGRFSESDDAGRSLAADVRSCASDWLTPRERSRPRWEPTCAAVGAAAAERSRPASRRRSPLAALLHIAQPQTAPIPDKFTRL